MAVIKYSICMVNLDMEKYIRQSILSISNQLDDEFEVVVVDGGSKDNSIHYIQQLAFLDSRIRPIFLPRDKNRKIGADRNISIQQARGEYVLLHLDCDDLYFRFLKDWIDVFHIVEKRVGQDFLLAGKQVNMGRRSFLLSRGPYKNLHFEDRELWNRLDEEGRLVRMTHQNISIRMPLGRIERIAKAIRKTFSEHDENLKENSFSKYFMANVRASHRYSKVYFLTRIFILIIVKLKGGLNVKPLLLQPEDHMIETICFDLGAPLTQEEKRFLNPKIFHTSLS